MPALVRKDLGPALKQLADERGLTMDEIVSDFEVALTAALKKLYGEAQDTRVEFNIEKSKIRAWQYKTVVEEVEDFDKQLSLEEAQEIKATYKIGDIVEEELELKDFGRVAAITMKQVMSQKTRDRARTVALEEINARAEQIVTAKITKIDRETFHLEIPGSSLEGILNQRGQIPGQNFKVGDFLKVYINRAVDDRHGEIYVTRTSPQFVRALFDLEVPEIGREEILVKAIAREAGYRTKISLQSTVENVDPIGACVGARGVRIQNILSEIQNEKIDLIPWSDDPLEFIASSLAPAPVLRVEADEASKTARVIVPNDKLSLAIGKSGMNVKLAARLTGWRIDVKSEERAAEEDAAQFEELTLG